MAVIAEAIEILDVATMTKGAIIASINRIQVYRLENTEPDAVIKMIDRCEDLTDIRTLTEILMPEAPNNR